MQNLARMAGLIALCGVLPMADVSAAEPDFTFVVGLDLKNLSLNTYTAEAICCVAKEAYKPPYSCLNSRYMNKTQIGVNDSETVDLKKSDNTQYATQSWNGEVTVKFNAKNHDAGEAQYYLCTLQLSGPGGEARGNPVTGDGFVLDGSIDPKNVPNWARPKRGTSSVAILTGPLKGKLKPLLKPKTKKDN